MRFEQVTALAFGCLKNEVLELAPNLNVVYGVNEAGKSTWLAAVYASLCGVRRGGGLTSEDRDFRERYRPWDGGSWEVAARIRLADGQPFDLRHDLEGKVACQATDAVTGRDVSNTIMFQGSPDGSSWVGLNRKLFMGVACVRQADILGVLQRAGELQESLQRAVASPEAKATAAAALSAIRKFRTNNVGLDRSNSRQPLAEARRTFKQAERALGAARAEHDSYLRRAQKVSELQAAALQAVKRRRAAEAAQLLREAADHRAKLERMEYLASKHPKRPAAPGDDEELVVRVASAIEAWETRPDATEPEGDSVQEIEASIASLPSFPQGDIEPHESVGAAVRAWDRAVTLLEEHDANKPSGDSSPGTATLDPWMLFKLADALSEEEITVPPELQTAAEEARRGVAKASRSERWFLPSAIFGGLAALATIALAAAGSPVGAVGAALGAVAAFLVAVKQRRGTPLWRALQEQSQAEAALSSRQQEAEGSLEKKRAATARAAELGLPAEPGVLSRRAVELEARQGRERSLLAWQQKRTELEATERVAAGALTQALRARGFEPDGALELAVDHYGSWVSKNRVQQEVASQISSLAPRLEDRRRLENAWHEAQQRRQEAEDAVMAVAGLADVEGDTGQVIVDGLRAWQRRRAGRAEEQKAAIEEWQELANLRRQLPEAERSARIAWLDLEAAQLGGEGVVAGDRVEAIEAELKAARESEHAARDEASHAQGELLRMATTLTPVSSAEEALTVAQRELDRVERLEQVLELTAQFLSNAESRVQRDIAPVLSAFVEPRLRRITSGRYSGVAIDPASLEVTLLDTSGARRRASRLSHGTSEQVYLLLRAALAEVLCKPDEPTPLLLDDVTVESDDERTCAIMEVLHELSEKQQIVVFTQETEVLEWAEQHLRDRSDSLVRLPTAIPSHSDPPRGRVERLVDQ